MIDIDCDWTPEREKEILEQIKALPDMDVECAFYIFANEGGGELSFSHVIVGDSDSVSDEGRPEGVIGTVHNHPKKLLKKRGIIEEFPSPLDIIIALKEGGRNYIKLDGKNFCSVYWRVREVPDEELDEISDNFVKNASRLVKIQNRRQVIETIKKLTNNSIYIEQIKL